MRSSRCCPACSRNSRTARTVTPAGEYPRIPYKEAMLKYGTDKPDLRNPMLITDVSEHFKGSGFGLFARIRREGRRGSRGPGAGHRGEEPQILRRHERMGAQRRLCRARLCDPQGRRVGRPDRQEPRRGGHEPHRRAMGLGPDDGIFFAAGKEEEAAKLAGAARTRVAEQLGLIEEGAFRFCWIVDFPMYEYDEEQKKIDFSHNPFSMPQGGHGGAGEKDPLDILAWQYDIVCNGVELSSRRDPEPPPGHHVQGVRDRRLYAGRGRHQFLRHDQRLQVRRSAARRLGARASTASSCCSPTSPTSARSSSSR